jgi:hypothetical protein
VAARFEFEHSLAFAPDNAPEILRSIPTLPGVFALHGPPAPEGQPPAQPYLTRAADLRRRITRILAPPDSQSKRLNLRSRVARIDYTITGSEFESTLTLYHASAAVFGLDEARRRLKLRTPFFLRFTAENDYPRVYSTNRLSKRALANFYGPFPSRAAADRYCDAVLDLFKLRRCVEDLAPYPEHPGCVYGEMNKCLAPCNQACTPAGAAAYAAEAAAVHAFFETHGESMLAPLTADRERASAELDFERAAELHAQWQKVKAAAALADPLVQPIPRLRAIILQKAVAAPRNEKPVILSEDATPVASESKDLRIDEPAAFVFLFHSGCLSGPARLSVLGVRAVKEQTSVGSSLFAQPLMLQAIPLEEESPNPESSDAISQSSVILSEGPGTEPEDSQLPSQSSVILSEEPGTEPEDSQLPSQSSVILSGDATAVASQSKDLRLSSQDSTTPALSPELRAAALIASLEAQATASTDLATLSDHLSLLRRWYYRPEKQRAGEVFFPREESADQTTWPIRRILNGAARISLGDPKPLAETQRDLATRNPAGEAQKPTRTKTLHAGRPDVERTVPLLEKNPDKPPTFKSRRKPQ